MVRYSDIIKNGIKKKVEAGKENLSYPEKEIRISDLNEFGTSSELHVVPVKKDTGYMKRLFKTIADYLKEVQRLVNNNESFEIKRAVDIVNHLIKTQDIIENFHQSLPLINNYYRLEKDYLMLHMIMVATSSLKIGKGLRYSQEQLLELGLSALFYDIGLFKIPDNILNKSGELTTNESIVIKKHTEIGGNILSRFQAQYPILSRVAYEHHERENGMGYPGSLRGDEICEYAKIIGLVDTFDAMIRNRPYRKALTGHFSVKELVESKNLMFSSKIIKAFLDEMGIFPVGSYVRLNNMGIGMVVATSKLYPLKPAIKLIFNSQGTRVQGETIVDLKETPVLCIKAAIGEEDFPS